MACKEKLIAAGFVPYRERDAYHKTLQISVYVTERELAMQAENPQMIKALLDARIRLAKSMAIEELDALSSNLHRELG
ncbi:MAG TPA: hypothetical protein PLK06_01485 [bacterium]|nr:hypothetical protein [bacterium]